MKTKLIFSAIVICWLAMAFAQTTTKKPSSSKSKTTTKTRPTVPGKDITITLKNLSEGSVQVFAGPKEELKNNLKKKTVGGLSKNTLYLHVNEIVCILNGGKTVSCATITGSATLLEINNSGNVITVK